ncbi:DUF2316 family protein [Methanolapillus millepedarum]|uniref:DUF2316 family protein n=1 Tax=Methanolapillus millepedarum TaxID=3028296 RepID=A0AA96V2E0_9EURY|nr:hypothetical protein MsAc7_07580 [Methanosarcinaceae archaeon Ac7]
MLTVAQTKQTSIELKENYRISELTPEVICADLRINDRELNKVLEMVNPDPTTVWRVRDYMERKIKEQGKTPAPYSALITNIWYRYD